MTYRLYKENGSGAHIEFYPKTASTEYTFNDMVMIGTSGYLELFTDVANVKPLGLIQKTIASTDSDYADNTRVPVLVAGPEAEYLADVGVGTGAVGDVGEFVDADGAGNPHQDIDLDNSDYDVFEVTGFISTSQMIVKINPVTGVLKTGPGS
jgi:putative ubiquitin-RnfH superfamily antitoxin RatB of RatAB toxin-antitoxin module